MVSFPVIFLPVVPEGTASNRVHHNEEDERYNVDDCNLLPITLDVGKNTRFARLAIVAEDIRIILPDGAIRVVGGKPSCRFIPHSCALVVEAAV